MSKVLVATAGSEQDEIAIERAVRLLGDDHQFLLLGVYSPVVPAVTMFPAGLAGTVPLSQRTWDDLQADARLEAERAVRHCAGLVNGMITVQVEEGDVGETICAVAASEEVDLIVVGSHHVGVLTRLFGRSISENVVQHAPCPVLVIPPPDLDKSD